MGVSLLFLLCVFVQVLARSENLFDYLIRSGTRIGKAVTDPLLEAAKGVVQLAEPVLVRDPDAIAAKKGVPSYIRYKGYPAETHRVRTSDDVVLVLHRIPGKPGSIPVLLQHGLLGSSFDFVANLPSQSLGFILHDEGYDVWMLNSRGNTYSSESERTKKHFYEYTWAQMAAYDMPDSIDHILRKTGHSKLHVIGHSRGTTITVAMLASKSMYNQKVRLAVLLSPVVFLDGGNPLIQNFIKLLGNPIVRYAADVWTENRAILTNARADLSYFGLNPSLCSTGFCAFLNDLGGSLLASSANQNGLDLQSCGIHFLVSLSGKSARSRQKARATALEEFKFLGNGKQKQPGAACLPFKMELAVKFFLVAHIDIRFKSRFAVYATHFPAGTSFNDLKHFMQMYNSKRFAYFDYGDTTRNVEAYGLPVPPAYDLSRVSAKMLIFYSKDDSFVSVKNGERVTKLFNNNIYKNTAILLPYTKFVHVDFLWSIYAKKQLYDLVIKRMHEYDDDCG